MHPTQSRMARAALKMGIRDVATNAKVSTNTLIRLEAGEELKQRTLEDLRRIYEDAGVKFIDADEWVGVMVRA